MAIEKPTIEVENKASNFEQGPMVQEYFPTTTEQAKMGVKRFLEAFWRFNK